MSDVKILIVEDELLTVALIRDVLQNRGYSIVGDAANGDEALALIERHRPDLIMMDITIKGAIDGIELTRIVNEKYRIPVIYLTAFADRKTVERAKTTESYGYLIKPFGEMELATTIEIALHKHRLDRKLRESEKRYRTLFDTMRDAVYMHNMDGTIIDFNPALEKMFGYSHDEVFGINVRDVFINPGDPDTFLQKIKQDGFIKDFAITLRRKDGEIINCIITANLERSPDDNRKIIRGVIRDITENEKTHRALKEQQDFIEAVLDSLPTIFYAIDREGRFVRWNRKLEELYGASVDRMNGVNVFDIMNEKNRELFRVMLEEGFNKGAITFETRLRQSGTDGELRDFIITGRRVSISGIDYLVGMGMDITESEKLRRALQEEQDFTAAVIASLPSTFFAVDRKGRFVRWNRKLEELAGLSGEQMRGVSIFDIVNENRELFRKMLDDGYSKGAVSVEVHLHLPGAGGAIMDLIVTGQRVDIGGTEYLVGAGVDITERKSMEEALRQSEEKYRSLVENINDVIYTLDTQGTFTYISPSVERLGNYRVEELLGKSFKVIVHPDDLEELVSQFVDTLNGKNESFVFRVLDKDGSVHHVRTSSRVIRVGGVITGLTGLMTDVTERKRMEEAMLENEVRYRAIFDGSLNLVYIHDFEGKFIDANNAALALLGYTRDDIPSLSFKDLVSGEDLVLAMNQVAEVIRTGNQSRIAEFNLRTRSGEYRSVETSASILYREGKSYAVLGVARDITERRKYIEELKSVHTENSNLLNSITSIMIGVDTHDVITHWNQMAEVTFRVPASEALGKKITGYDIDWEWDAIYSGISSCIIGNCPINLTDINYHDKNGKPGLLGITINPIKDESDMLKGFLIHGKDITEKRMVEQQLLQSSKMATVGEMATGVAHELNQPLNVIKMASQYLMDGLNEKYATEDFIRERMQKIITQVDRAAHMINHLREFGRKSDYDFGTIDPNMPVRVAFDMLGEQLRINDIGVKLDLAEDLPSIRADLHKLEQVFINLIVNAKDAMLGAKNPLQEKNIVVKSYHESVSGNVLISFSDTGTGIPDDIIERIFEPFFTTKEVGSGTGLGLSISYGIIKAHRGTISASSKGEGTVFNITLPVSKGPDEPIE